MILTTTVPSNVLYFLSIIPCFVWFAAIPAIISAVYSMYQQKKNNENSAMNGLDGDNQQPVSFGKKPIINSNPMMSQQQSSLMQQRQNPIMQQKQTNYMPGFLSELLKQR